MKEIREMADASLRAQNESMQQTVSCGWCRDDAAVELEGRPYCGTCFLWIAVRQHPAGPERIRKAVGAAYFARSNAASR